MPRSHLIRKNCFTLSLRQSQHKLISVVSWAADGQYGNELQLEKNWAKCFQVYLFCLGKLAKVLIIVYFCFENSLHIFLLVFYRYFGYDKGA